MDVKNEAEQHIFWKHGKGNLSFWHDNWTNKGALSNIVQQGNKPMKIKVSNFINQNQWNLSKLNFVLPANIVSEVQDIKFDLQSVDYPIWLPDQSGLFSSKSAWQKSGSPGLVF